MSIRSGLLVFVTILLIWPLGGVSISAEITPIQLMEMDNSEVLLVDIRASTEQPQNISHLGFQSVRVFWPQQQVSSVGDDNLQFVRFFSSLKRWAQAYPGRRLVLVCAVGGRSLRAMRIAPELGYRNLDHLAGGLLGSEGSIGLVDALRFQRSE